MIETITDDRVTFLESSHSYMLDRAELPSVTQVMSDMGLENASLWAREHHRDRGRFVHHGCRLVLDGTYDREGTSAALVPYIDAFQRFLEDEPLDPILAEQPLASETDRYAGTLDLFAVRRRDGARVIYDLKSGHLPPLVGVQLAGYERLLRNNTSRPPETGPIERVSIRLSDDGRYKLRDHGESTWTAYWACTLSLWKLRKRHNLISTKGNTTA